MIDRLKLLAGISRPEFLPANMGSLVIGLAWGLDPSAGFAWETAALALLSFLVITVVSAIGAQLNTLGDHELDSRDGTKAGLVEKTRELGLEHVRTAVLAEIGIGIALLAPLLLMKQNLAFLALWLAGLFFAWAYSMPPMRLKARSLMAFASLCLVLSILPITFVYLAFADAFGVPFLVFLAGHTLTVYALIIPAEIRDYFVDSAAGAKTMTVWLGLKNASLLGIALLVAGPVISAAGLLTALDFSVRPLLGFPVAVMAVIDVYVLRKYGNLYRLSRKYESSVASYRTKDVLEGMKKELAAIAVNNPKWITMVSQGIVLANLVLLAARMLMLAS